MAQNWLDKILLKAQDKFKLTTEETQQVEQEITVNFGDAVNRANTNDLKRNNGNVPMTGNWSGQAPEGEIEGFTLFRQEPNAGTKPQFKFDFTAPQFDTQQTQVVEQRVMSEASDIARQREFTQNATKGGDGTRGTVATDGSTMVANFRKDVASVEYRDGKAIITKKDGTVKERPAMKGEPGYVKTGDSISERLDKFYAGRYSKASFEEKVEMAKRYFTEYFKASNLSDEKQLADYKKIVHNTGFEGEDAKVLGAVIHELRAKNRGTAYTSTMERTTHTEQAQNYTEGVISTIGSSGDDSEAQAELVSLTSASAKRYGFEASYTTTLTSNFYQINPANLNFVAETAYDTDAAAANKGFADVVSSPSVEEAVNENPELNEKIKARFGSGFNIESMSGTEIHACNESVCTMIEAGDIDGATEILNKINKSAHYSDEHRAAVSKASTKHATGNSGSIETRKDAAQLAATANASMVDAEKEMAAIEETNAAMANADDEVKGSYLEGAAVHIGDLEKENQLDADKSFREIDTPAQTYNITAANYGQNLAVENQEEFVNRTVESGNEEAVNNIAKNIYGYSEDSRGEIEEKLKSAGFDSTLDALEEAKKAYEEELARLEAERKAKAEQEAKDKQAQSQTQQSQSQAPQQNQKPSTPAPAASQTPSISGGTSSAFTGRTAANFSFGNSRVNEIISDNTLNTAERVKEIKNLPVEQQKLALERLMQNPNPLHVKGLILNGMKSEVVSYLLNNFNAQNRSILQSLEYLLDATDKKKMADLIEQVDRQNVQKPQLNQNFFIGNND